MVRAPIGRWAFALHNALDSKVAAVGGLGSEKLCSLSKPVGRDRTAAALEQLPALRVGARRTQHVDPDALMVNCEALRSVGDRIGEVADRAAVGRALVAQQGDRVLVRAAQHRLEVEVDVVVAKRVGHLNGDVLESKEHDADDDVDGARHAELEPERDEAVRDQEEVDDQEDCQRVEVREGHRLLEPVGDLAAVAAEGEGELAKVAEEVGGVQVAPNVGVVRRPKRVLDLAERPDERQEGLIPFVVVKYFVLLEEAALPDDAPLLLADGRAAGRLVKGVVLDVQRGENRRARVPCASLSFGKLTLTRPTQFMSVPPGPRSGRTACSWPYDWEP